jgi:hypothetical protein
MPRGAAQANQRAASRSTSREPVIMMEPLMVMELQ